MHRPDLKKNEKKLSEKQTNGNYVLLPYPPGKKRKT